MPGNVPNLAVRVRRGRGPGCEITIHPDTWLLESNLMGIVISDVTPCPPSVYRALLLSMGTEFDSHPN